MSDCIFCKIATGEIPSKRIYEDADCVAFHDLHPQAPVHVLVIPRRHIGTANDLSPADAELMGRIVTRLPELARSLGIADRGYRTVMNCLEEAGQSVFHLHFHLLGGRAMGWPPG